MAGGVVGGGEWRAGIGKVDVGINSLAARRENALRDRADWLPGWRNALPEVKVSRWESENGRRTCRERCPD
jgi:hypothetical protein